MSYYNPINIGNNRISIKRWKATIDYEYQLMFGTTWELYEKHTFQAIAVDMMVGVSATETDKG